MDADVLYCRLNGYSGNYIQQNYKATVSYDTTRGSGIRVQLDFQLSGKKLVISMRFLTHLYQSTVDLPRACSRYALDSPSACYQTIFLDIFKLWEVRIGGRIKFTRRSRQNGTAFNAMQRKSGLKMTGPNGQTLAALRYEYRGEYPSDDTELPFDSCAHDLALDEVYGVFVAEKMEPDGLLHLIEAIKGFGLSPEFEQNKFDNSLKHLATLSKAGTAG